MAVACIFRKYRERAHLHSVMADEAYNANRPCLAKAVHASKRLLLHRHIERWLQEEHVAGCECTVHSAHEFVHPRGQLEPAVGPADEQLDPQQVTADCPAWVKFPFIT